MLDSISCVVDVDNRVVSIILNEYVLESKDADVKLELDVHVPHELFVSAADLYILIGNTMDNALDACAELPAEQRWISMKLRTHNDLLFYELQNPYDASHLDRVRGKCHGFGLKNVRRCIEKYDESLDIDKENGLFRVTAHLNSV